MSERARQLFTSVVDYCIFSPTLGKNGQTQSLGCKLTSSGLFNPKCCVVLAHYWVKYSLLYSHSLDSSWLLPWLQVKLNRWQCSLWYISSIFSSTQKWGRVSPSYVGVQVRRMLTAVRVMSGPPVCEQCVSIGSPKLISSLRAACLMI